MSNPTPDQRATMADEIVDAMEEHYEAHGETGCDLKGAAVVIELIREKKGTPAQRAIAASILRQARFMQKEHGLDFCEGIWSTYSAWLEGTDGGISDEAEAVAQLLEG